MITKQIISTCKTTSHLEFIVKVSVPLDDISKEMAEDCCNMFEQTFPIPVDRYLNFIVSESGEERISVITQPKA